MVALEETGWDEPSRTSGVYPGLGNPWERHNLPLQSSSLISMTDIPSPAIVSGGAFQLMLERESTAVGRVRPPESPIDGSSNRLPSVLASRHTRNLLLLLTALHERGGQE